MSGRLKTRKKTNPVKIQLFKRSFMQINFSQTLQDTAGQNLQLDKDSPALTLKEISTLAIKAVIQDDQNLSYKDKLEWSRLSEQIAKSGDTPINVDSAMASKLKERITKVFPAIMVAAAVELAVEGSL